MLFKEKYLSLHQENTQNAMNNQKLQQTLAEYFKTQPVLKAWLFGSYARGEENAKSDVDILVVSDHSQPVGLKFFGMYEDLKELLGRDVDLVTEPSWHPLRGKV